MGSLFDRFDVVFTPTLAHATPEIGHLDPAADFDEPSTASSVTSPSPRRTTPPAPPAISLPLGQTRDGLPIGMQFAAYLGQEQTLLELRLRARGAAPLRPHPGLIHRIAANRPPVSFTFFLRGSNTAPLVCPQTNAVHCVVKPRRGLSRHKERVDVLRLARNGAVAVAAAAAMALAGCSSGSDSDKAAESCDPDAGRRPPPVRSARTPQHRDTAPRDRQPRFLGPPMAAGVKLAVNEINANGGVLGKPVKLTTGDLATPPPTPPARLSTANSPPAPRSSSARPPRLCR